ncbi:serine/threonine protein kinase [Microcoleus sp. FACHB-831]|uniref:WD40 repeat domain-containing serine/threonine-protein kinase n=1 Tax=Microcoleus sp. FACHB-831 TaxID=2692827 RepID=UPI0016852B9C|nr:WD40 repeat domain-containing serine/threonine-protein kinase [Microcoleus sp. FACHB-831]MBD1921335.1 serine/threonine protein kinase [Microcoleus sp. FACHB-831]
MRLCINPHCAKLDHPNNDNNRFCQSCGSDLLLQGRYQVMRLLSDKSGFGKIYEADEGGTPKILKVLKEYFNNNSKVVELFQQEAAVLKKLNHPGVPKVDVDGYFRFQAKNSLTLHCIIMEKIDGHNLEEWLQQHGNNPISEQQAIGWLKQLTEILHLVHQNQWFHRDIKPPNIMLRPDGRLVLIDFGTAREATITYIAKLGGGHSITRVDSPGYTPPEQANGQAVPQSDFFALGRTFVYLLTAKNPSDFYDANNDVLRWQEAANISTLLADFIDKLMAPRPGDRPPNTEVLLQQIGEIERKLIQPVKTPQMATTLGIFTSPLFLKTPQMATTSSIPKTPSFPLAARNKLLVGGVILTGLGGLLGVLMYGQLTFNSDPISLVISQSYLKNTLQGHSGFVYSVAISPDGQTLVSGSDDKTIKIWNLASGKLIRTLQGNSHQINSVAISPDGQTLVSGSDDYKIKIWNLASGKLIRTLQGHSDDVETVAISPDGQTLVSGSGDKTIKIWNLASGKLIRTLKSRSFSVETVAISPDGQTLVSGSLDNTIKIWNLASGKLIRTLEGHSAYVTSVAISPDGQTLVSGSGDDTIKIWNLASGKLISTLQGHSDDVETVAISPDGQTLVSGSDSGDKTIKIWNLASGNSIRTLKGHSSGVLSVAISADGQTLVSGGRRDNTIKIWRMPR